MAGTAERERARAQPARALPPCRPSRSGEGHGRAGEMRRGPLRPPKCAATATTPEMRRDRYDPRNAPRPLASPPFAASGRRPRRAAHRRPPIAPRGPSFARTAASRGRALPARGRSAGVGHRVVRHADRWFITATRARHPRTPPTAPSRSSTTRTRSATTAPLRAASDFGRDRPAPPTSRGGSDSRAALATRRPRPRARRPPPTSPR